MPQCYELASWFKHPCQILGFVCAPGLGRTNNEGVLGKLSKPVVPVPEAKNLITSDRAYLQRLSDVQNSSSRILLPRQTVALLEDELREKGSRDGSTKLIPSSTASATGEITLETEAQHCNLLSGDQENLEPANLLVTEPAKPERHASWSFLLRKCSNSALLLQVLVPVVQGL
jgi:hypothetical protein